MKALVAALNRIATALEQLVPALTQATREARYMTEYRSDIQLCIEHWNGGQANEDDYGLISYCPAEDHRDSCHVVDAEVVMRDRI